MKVLLIHGSHVLSEYLSGTLQQSPQVQAVGSVHCSLDVIGLALLWVPDVVVLDLDLKAQSPIQVLRTLKDALPSCFVIALTSFPNSTTERICKEAGAGYVLPKIHTELQLRRALQAAGPNRNREALVFEAHEPQRHAIAASVGQSESRKR